MRKTLPVILLFLMLSAADLSALTVTVTFDNPSIPAAVITDIQTKIGTELAKYDNMPELARGFANANTYATNVATLRGYQGYDIFAIALGSMVSIQAPNNDPMFFSKLGDQLDSGDVYAGVGANPIAVSGGVNLSFLIEGLYMSFKFGKLKFSTGHEYNLWKYSYSVELGDSKVSYDSNLYALLFDYQLHGERAILSRAFVWRGLNIESGVIYSNTTVSYYKKLPTQTYSFTSGLTYDITLDPSVDLVLDTRNLVVPVELYTSVRLLYVLNLGFGGGFDYVPYGKTSFSLKSAGPITVTSPVTSNGTANIEAGTKDVEPNKFRPKLTANLGFSIGPVFLDIPMTYYCTDNGYAIGISLGMAW